MNLLLTNECNNDCSFCFAKKFKAEEKQCWTMESVRELVQGFRKNSVFKILGGEPSLHPDFIPILKLLEEKEMTTLVISNFLFDKDIRDQLLTLKRTSYLVNATEVPHEKKDLWKDNVFFLGQHVREQKLFPLTLSITLNPNLKNPLDLLENLYQDVNFDSVRLSLDFSKKLDFYYQNYDVGHSLEKVVDWLKQHGIRVNIDCSMIPCIFDSPERARRVFKKLSYVEKPCEGSCDTLPDREVLFCFPLKDLVHSPLQRGVDMFSLLREKYIQTYSEYEDPRCKTCSFREELCSGAPLCLLI